MSLKFRRMGALAIVLVSAACASHPTWQKDGVSPDTTRTALSECKYQIGVNKIPAEKQQELLTYCMQGKGFRLR